MCGFGEQGLGPRLVPRLPVKAHVARRLRPHRRCVGIERRAKVDAAGQHVVVDHDGLGRVLRRLLRLRHDEGDRVADVTHLAVGQHGMRHLGAAGAVAVLQRDNAGQAADAVRNQVLAGEDSQNAVHAGRHRGVDRQNARRRMRATQHDADGRVCHRDIVGVAPAADEQARVFHAPNRLGHAELCHAHVPSMALTLSDELRSPRKRPRGGPSPRAPIPCRTSCRNGASSPPAWSGR